MSECASCAEDEHARHLLMNGYTHQLPVALDGATVDTDNDHLPGACAGPDGKFGCGALSSLPSPWELVQMQRQPAEVIQAQTGIHPAFAVL